MNSLFVPYENELLPPPKQDSKLYLVFIAIVVLLLWWWFTRRSPQVLEFEKETEPQFQTVKEPTEPEPTEPKKKDSKEKEISIRDVGIRLRNDLLALRTAPAKTAEIVSHVVKVLLEGEKPPQGKEPPAQPAQSAQPAHLPQPAKLSQPQPAQLSKEAYFSTVGLELPDEEEEEPETERSDAKISVETNEKLKTILAARGLK